MLSHSRSLTRTTTTAVPSITRTLSSSPSSSRPSPSFPTPQNDPNHRLYRQIFRAAARGADEVASLENGGENSTGSRYREAGFRATQVRKTPGVTASRAEGKASLLGGPPRRWRTRGALVEVDRERLAALEATRGKGGRRGFATSAVQRRVAEESLQEVGSCDIGAGYEGKGDADGFGEYEEEAGTGRIRGAVQAGDYVHTTRCALLFTFVFLLLSLSTSR